MSKEFIKFVEDEELYQAACDFILDIERPKYTEGMSFQDYGALCVAFDEFKKKLQSRLDAMHLEGQKDVV